MEIKDVTNARGAVYGDFRIQFRVAQQLKDVVYTSCQASLSAAQREILDMIMHKVSRIIIGDPNYLDNWIDIQGYASLAQREIEERGKSDGLFS